MLNIYQHYPFSINVQYAHVDIFDGAQINEREPFYVDIETSHVDAVGQAIERTIGRLMESGKLSVLVETR